MSSHNHDSRYYTETETDTKLNTKAPTSHASTGTGYGLGTTANYGHTKLYNALTASSYTDGMALSAYQGYLLNNSINARTIYNTGWGAKISSTSLTTAVDEDVYSYTISTSGWYYIETQVAFSTNATGSRQITFGTLDNSFKYKVGASPSGNTILSGQKILYVSAGTAVRVSALQNSGSSLTATGYFFIIMLQKG